MGASTGGVAALTELLSALPAGMPPIVIAQHMPPGYTTRFARRLQERLSRDVAEARDGEPLGRGMVRIAPGDRHLEVKASPGGFITQLGGASPVSGHCPSVDVLFGSVAKAAAGSAAGVILTGMGRDGAAGLRALNRTGARCLGQSERSCVVYGMPRAARELGAVHEEMDLDRLPQRLRDLAHA
ncbi:MAG: CheB methylesterase domain-containing protein [Pseudomonadota bacterium]